MTAPDPESLLRHAATRDAGVTARCLDDETIASLVDDTIDDARRPAALAHLADCARCRRAVVSLSRALANPVVAREIPTSSRTRRRVLAMAIPVAAAAVLALLVVPQRGDDGSPHRAPTITAVSSPVLMSPVGVVASAQTLRWSTVAGADRYRTTLFDAAGAVVYETQTVDSSITLPDSIGLVPGRSYLWKVDARTGWGRWSGSELIEFSIR
jgi:hypothetical protein